MIRQEEYGMIRDPRRRGMFVNVDSGPPAGGYARR